MITLPQQGTWLPADTQTPISLYLTLVREKQGFLLESTEVDGRLGRYSLIGWDFRLILSCVHGRLDVQSFDPRLHPLKEFGGQEYAQGLRACLDALTVTGPENLGPLPAVTRSVCGYMAYNMGGIFEPALADRLPPEDGRSIMVLPGKVILFDHLHHRCCYLTLDSTTNLNGCQRPSTPAPPVVGAIATTPDHDEFLRRVGRAKDLITEGEAIQIVLSTRFSAPFSGSAFELYRRLRQINPSPYTFFMSFGDLTIMGSSPELLIRCEDGLLQLRPIAGTRVRGATEAEDQELAEDLLADEKERAEHVMLVDLGRNDLGRIAAPGSVHVDRYMQVERFSHVMHLTSYLSARLADGLDAIDVLKAGFPAGTVSGAPKIRAMQIIADEEQLDRGPYAGCIGWIGLDQGQVNLDTGITIRSLWVENGQIHWQAGAGLVFDSDPEKEWQECHNKARAILKAITSTEAAMILLIDNFDSFTFNLVQVFQSLGANPLVLRNNEPEILDLAKDPRLQGAIISPGPSHPRNTGLCLQFLDLVPRTTPVLGVCLGHQTLSHHSGVTVGQAKRIMHGKTSSIRHSETGLFEGLPNPMQIGRYHSLAVHEEGRTDLPFDITARTESGEVMALAFRDRPWVGVQFHPESVLTPEGPALLNNFLKMCNISAE